MGSWYCEFLIKNQELIRSNVNVGGEWLLAYFPITEYGEREDIMEYDYENNNEPVTEYDFENETYQNLLLVERKIEELRDKKVITENEYKIINLIKNSIPPKNMESIMGMNKFTIYKIFSNVCERIGYILGGEFSNEGYIEKICKNRKLSEDQVQKIRNYFSKNTVEKII
jgi:hypothetical protein